MAPKKSANAATSQQTRSDAPTQEASQESQSSIDIQALIASHKAKVKERKRQREQAVQKAHDARMAELEADLERAYVEAKATIRPYAQQLEERFCELEKRKLELETKWHSIVADMENALAADLEQIKLAIDDRLDRLSR